MFPYDDALVASKEEPCQYTCDAGVVSKNLL